MDQNSDQLSIDTPELVPIELPLAGIGSRFVAVLVDMLIWGAAMVVVSLVFWVVLPGIGAFSKRSAQWAAAVYVFLVFALNWGYFTLFEAFWNGRTPGKRAAKIRVIQQSGRPIGVFEAMARNLIRYIDQIPFFYGVGVIAVFATRQHQRLGDLAAGTVVVRDREPEAPLWADSGSLSLAQQMPGQNALIPEPHTAVTLPASGIAKLSAADLEILEGFLARRLDLPLETRGALAKRIAEAIQAKSGLQQPQQVSVETFLEAVTRQLRDVARMR
jgi:uncharacterized RDD family membrane protein YckC